MSNKTQLPAEVKIEIDNKAGEYADQMHGYIGDDIHVGYIAGATEYATKLRQVEQERDRKEVAYEMMLKTAEKYFAEIGELKAKVERYEKALKKIYDEFEHEDYGEHSSGCPVCIAREALAGEGEKEDIKDGKQLTVYYQKVESAISFATWLTINSWGRLKEEEWMSTFTKEVAPITELYQRFEKEVTNG
jgi:DNA repair exonuclease SbcCD ATPase subunit